MNEAGGGYMGSSFAQVGELRQNWGWFLALGIVLLVIGVLALGATVALTLVSVLFLGWLLVISGLVQAFHAFKSIKQNHFLLHLADSILRIVIGVLIISRPGESALALTLFIAMFFIVDGLIRIFGAIATRPESWGWLVFGGAVALLLGVLVLTQWPVTGLWVIGMFVGIDVILTGWALVMLSLAAHHLPTQAG